MPLKKCKLEACGAEFLPKQKNQVFCKPECRLRRTRKEKNESPIRKWETPVGKNKCIYDPDVHGLGIRLEAHEVPGKCGKRTANRGYNRYYCSDHWHLVSNRGEGVL